MTDTTPPDSDLAAIKHRFAARLSAELPGIITLFRKLAGNDEDRAPLQELQRQLHRLAGSAGSFGFRELGERARELEQDIAKWLEQGLSGDYARAYGELARTALQLETLSTSSSEEPEYQTELPVSGPVEVSVIILGQRAFLPSALISQLHSLDYRTETVKSPADLADSEEFIVLLDLDTVDLGLPAIKNLTLSRHIVIGFSEQADFSMRKRCVQAGIRIFYPLATDPTLVINRIDQIVRRLNAPPQRVMIVEDDDELASMYATYLRQAGVEVLIALEPEQCMDHIEQFKPELILMDLHMPTMSGSELATVIRQHPGLEALPIVFLSGESNLSAQVEAINSADADDFLTKPIRAEVLVASVRSRINRYRQLSELMSRDSLTGLMTHARIKEAIQMETSRASRRGSSVAVAMLDLDDFKSVNDRFGHAAGDKVITSLALLLRHALRESDLKGRYGGEEFVVLLPDSAIVDAEARLEEVRKRFETLGLEHQGAPLRCTVSIGLAGNQTFPGIQGEDLIDQADKALYAAKAAGKNRTVVATRGE